MNYIPIPTRAERSMWAKVIVDNKNWENFHEGVEWCIHSASQGKFAHSTKANGLCEERFYVVYRNIFLFQSINDAIMFTLRFNEAKLITKETTT